MTLVSFIDEIPDCILQEILLIVLNDLVPSVQRRTLCYTLQSSVHDLQWMEEKIHELSMVCSRWKRCLEDSYFSRRIQRNLLSFQNEILHEIDQEMMRLWSSPPDLPWGWSHGATVEQVAGLEIQRGPGFFYWSEDGQIRGGQTNPPRVALIHSSIQNKSYLIDLETLEIIAQSPYLKVYYDADYEMVEWISAPQDHIWVLDNIFLMRDLPKFLTGMSLSEPGLFHLSKGYLTHVNQNQVRVIDFKSGDVAQNYVVLRYDLILGADDQSLAYWDQRVVISVGKVCAQIATSPLRPVVRWIRNHLLILDFIEPWIIKFTLYGSEYSMEGMITRV